MLISAKYDNTYLISSRKRKRWTAEEEVELFTSLESKERDLYRLFFSLHSLCLPLTQKIQSLLYEEGEMTDVINRGLIRMIRDLSDTKNKRHTHKALFDTIESVIAEFRLLDAPRLWTAYVVNEIANSEMLLNSGMKNVGQIVNSAAYQRWAQEVKKESSKIQTIKNNFIEDNLGLVGRMIMQRYRTPRIQTSFADLQQEGYFGLLKAMNRFEYRKGLKFSTYAAWWLRHALSRALSDKDKTIRIPVHIQDKIQKLNIIKHDFFRKHGREPNVQELVELSGFAENTVREIKDSMVFYSLDRSLGHDKDEADERTGKDLIADETSLNPMEEYSCKEVNESLLSALKTLTPRELAVIEYRFGLNVTPIPTSRQKRFNDEGVTLADIGNKFDLSRERIRQIERNALQKLEVYLGKQKIKASSDISAL